MDPLNNLSWIGQVNVAQSFKGAKSGETKHSVAPQSTSMGTGVSLILRTVIESKKAVEEVDNRTAYKGSSFRIVVSVGIMASQLRNLPSCPEALKHFPTCHWLMVWPWKW